MVPMQAILFTEQLHANVVLFIDWIQVQIIHNYNVSFDLTIFGSLPIIILLLGLHPTVQCFKGGIHPLENPFSREFLLLDFTT